MATRAPIPQTAHTPPNAKGKAKIKPLRLQIRREPGTPLGDDAVSSPKLEQTSQPETVVAAGKFKATCLQLLDAAEKGESVTITKRGKVVARLVPPAVVQEKPFVPLLGLMKGKVKILGDIVSPDFEAWGMEDPYKAKKKKKR